MTAKEILKKYFHGLTDEQFEKMVSEYPINNVFGAMNEYAWLIADNAVYEMRTRVDVNVLDAWDRGYNAGIIEAMKILSRVSRIKQLTEE